MTLLTVALGQGFQPGDALQPSNFYDHCWSELFCSAGGLIFVLVDEFIKETLKKKI